VVDLHHAVFEQVVCGQARAFKLAVVADVHVSRTR
jgi:hypothetical protein